VSKIAIENLIINENCVEVCLSKILLKYWKCCCLLCLCGHAI